MAELAVIAGTFEGGKSPRAATAHRPGLDWWGQNFSGTYLNGYFGSL
jgi:hypothetical protein